MIGALLLAAQFAIVVHAPDAVAMCDAIELTVAVSAPARYTPQLIPPPMAPFDVLRSSGVPHVSPDPSGSGSIVEYHFVLTTDRAGKFVLAPFEARIGRAVVRSRPTVIIVQPGPRSNVPIVVARARIDTGLDVNFRARTVPETVFVGQQANYEVAVFLNETVRERLRRNPTFFPPDMQSMLAYDLPSHSEPPRRAGTSGCYDALVYQRALFPLMPGRFAIPPAQLVYSLPLSSSFFSREETHELATDSTVIVAVEPPARGRPADYGGAVGHLRVAARLDATASRVGDPVVLTVRVTGTGNVKLLPRPTVGVPWGSLVKGDERVNVDTSARRIAGSKEFDWVLTPKIAGELDLPPIRYSYFNPDSRRYEVASTSPTHLRVGRGTLASADTAKTEVLLPLRTRYRGRAPQPPHEHPVFWAILALAPLPALSLRERERRRRRAPGTIAPVDRLRGLSGGSAHDACEVRRLFTNSLADRVGLKAESFTRPGALARGLRRRGVSTETALDAERFLRILDEAAFSPTGALPEQAADRARSLYAAVDDEALSRARIAGVATSIVVILALAVTTAHAVTADAAWDAFDRGVAAYSRRDFVGAREAFILAATTEPSAPDAWANLGTASWAAADTARSVAAWQRALRLEPLASDVRERVELVHTLPWSAAGYVPPMPAEWVFNIAALLWCVAWGAAAFAAARGQSLGRRQLATASVLAVVLAVGAFALSDRLVGRHLAVVRRTASLSVDPEMGGERGATAIIGEVVRVTGQQGAWSRVSLDDGRDGWIENAALLSLDLRDAGQIAGD